MSNLLELPRALPTLLAIYYLGTEIVFQRFSRIRSRDMRMVYRC